MSIECLEGRDLYCRRAADYLPGINGGGKDEALPVRDLCGLSAYVARYEFPAFRMMVDYGDSVFFRAGETREVKVSVVNSHTMCQQQWARIRVYMPEGVETINGKAFELPLNNLYGAKAEARIVFRPELYEGGKLEFLVEVSLEGRHSTGTAKVVLMREAG